MIELRNFFTKRLKTDGFERTPYKRMVMILQYRISLNDDDLLSDTLWSEWIDVPDVMDFEENQ